MNKGCFYIIFLLMVFFAKSLYSQVVINEISNANGSVIYDENEEANDWIELYNTSSSMVNLFNYTLTDDSTNLSKWVFPNVSIPAQSFIIVFASGKDTLDDFLHANFKLSSNGEKVVLSNASGYIVDEYYLGNLQIDHSFGRKPDGSSGWCLFSQSSPGGTNNSSECYEGYEIDPFFSLDAGFYDTQQLISLYTPSPTGIIKYTTDGEIPSSSASEYSSPIVISNTKVVAANCYSSNNKILPSNTVKKTYFIGENDLNLPVFSITLNPKDLWDYNEGMYVDGPNASPEFPFYGANFWAGWEKLAHIEYFDKEKIKQFELDAGLQIHGGRSRAFPQRSFRVISRKEYGENRMEYPLIGDKPFINSYKSINLRNGGQEYAMSRIRDAFMSRLLKGTHSDYIAYEPVILFLNGDYWGIYGLRERQDHHYIESNHKIPSELVDIAKHRGNDIWAQSGSVEAFFTMYDQITLSDPGKSEYFENTSKILDLENFADYMLSQIYYGNDDWINHTTPCNNIRFWRSQNGGRWRYAHFDLDKGLGGKGRLPETNNLAMVHNPIGPNVHSDMFRTLLKNTEFRYYFVNRYADLMNTVFQSENMKMIAYEMRDEMKPSMERHFTKWDGSYDNWLSEIDEMLDFNIARLPLARQHIQQEFQLNGQVDVTLKVSPSGAGRIKISTIIPGELPWKGVYFDGVPVTITAIPNPGFTFDYWAANANISNPEINGSLTLNISSSDVFTAFFKGSPIEPKLAFSEINYHSQTSKDAGDWVELHNYGNIALNLSGWFIKDKNEQNKFMFPFGTIIPPQGYLVFSCDTSRFNSQHSDVTNYLGQLSYNFKNSSDQVRLYKYDNSLFLSVSYSDSPPWPTAADGKGKTLELISPDSDPNIASNWFAGCDGGSPGKGYDSHCLTAIPENATGNLFHMEVFPNPSGHLIYVTISMDGEDLANLSFSMYDFTGKEVLKIPSLKNNNFEINRADFNAGIYIIKLNSGEYFLTEKIIFK